LVKYNNLQSQDNVHHHLYEIHSILQTEQNRKQWEIIESNRQESQEATRTVLKEIEHINDNPYAGTYKVFKEESFIGVPKIETLMNNSSHF